MKQNYYHYSDLVDVYILYSQVVKPTLTLPKEFSFATGRPAVKAPTGVAFLFKFMLILLLLVLVFILDNSIPG